MYAKPAQSHKHIRTDTSTTRTLGKKGHPWPFIPRALGQETPWTKVLHRRRLAHKRKDGEPPTEKSLANQQDSAGRSYKISTSSSIVNLFVSKHKKQLSYMSQKSQRHIHLSYMQEWGADIKWKVRYEWSTYIQTNGQDLLNSKQKQWGFSGNNQFHGKYWSPTSEIPHITLSSMIYIAYARMRCNQQRESYNYRNLQLYSKLHSKTRSKAKWICIFLKN